ncbi:MAG: 2-oxo acid dehydrogenase subunit E2 [Lentisphaeria bacterium]|nr:2-oxo acid dehydrogenase subunit E2 [Lentisphaeria bacterium]
MEKELALPGLGENISKVQVARVLVQAGASVAADDPLLEVEADKAVVEIPAAAAGTVRQVLVSPGDTLTIGQPFAVIETGQTEPEPQPPDADEPAPNTPGPQPDQAPATPTPDTPPETRPETAPPAARPTHGAAPVPPSRSHVPAAPSVRRFAREIGTDVDTVRGTGPHGRVSLADVKRHARELNLARGGPSAGSLPRPLPDFGRWGPVRREPMSSIRWATAEQVTRCWLAIPRVTHFDDADITQLERLRQRYKPRAAAAGGNLTMAVMVVKVVAEALRKFPLLNASVDMDTRQIVLKDYVHIGIAVATGRGLLVPVLRDADRRNMIQLAVEIDAVAKRCREGKISREELEGGTFTVTNLGSIGGSHFTPIVNWPEVAILGIGRAAPRVTLHDGRPEARTMLPLSLSYDHRLIDGADAARFVRWIAEAIEEPLLLSLEGGTP